LNQEPPVLKEIKTDWKKGTLREIARLLPKKKQKEDPNIPCEKEEGWVKKKIGGKLQQGAIKAKSEEAGGVNLERKTTKRTPQEFFG